MVSIARRYWSDTAARSAPFFPTAYAVECGAMSLIGYPFPSSRRAHAHRGDAHWERHLGDDATCRNGRPLYVRIAAVLDPPAGAAERQHACAIALPPRSAFFLWRNGLPSGCAG